MAYLFHHSDFAPSIGAHLPYFMTRVNLECIRIEVDQPCDDRSPQFFRFLTDRRANHVLRAVMGHNDPELRFKTALDAEDLKRYTIPYDAMPVTVDGEDLTVAYSIKSPDAPIRRGIMGPHCVRLYESEIPHFGPIFVYRSEKREYDTEGDFVVEHKWLEMKTSPERICECLRQGILGPCG